MNYFHFFEIPESFNPDLDALRRLFLKNSKRFHPDFHSNESDEKQAELLELSTQNNRAFQVLSDPDLRMKHILEINGMLENGGKNFPMPPDFLMEMMEINEALDELEAGGDVQSITDLQKRLADLKSEMRAEVFDILENWTADKGKPGDLENVRDFFLKTRYIFRAEEKLDTFAPLSDGGL